MAVTESDGFGTRFNSIHTEGTLYYAIRAQKIDRVD
jgi:hypothetical protein